MRIALLEGVLRAIGRLAQSAGSTLGHACRVAVYDSNLLMRAPCCGAHVQSTAGLNASNFARFLTYATETLTRAVTERFDRPSTHSPVELDQLVDASVASDVLLQVCSHAHAQVTKLETNQNMEDVQLARFWLRVLLSMSGFVTPHELLCDDAHGLLYAQRDDVLAVGDAVGRRLYALTTASEPEDGEDRTVTTLRDVMTVRTRCEQMATKNTDAMRHVASLCNELHVHAANVGTRLEDAASARAEHARQAQQALQQATARDATDPFELFLSIDEVARRVASTLYAHTLDVLYRSKYQQPTAKLLIHSLDSLRDWQDDVVAGGVGLDQLQGLASWEDVHHTLHQLSSAHAPPHEFLTLSELPSQWLVEPEHALATVLTDAARAHLRTAAKASPRELLYGETSGGASRRLARPGNKDSIETTLRTVNSLSTNLCSPTARPLKSTSLCNASHRTTTPCWQLLYFRYVEVDNACGRPGRADARGPAAAVRAPGRTSASTAALELSMWVITAASAAAPDAGTSASACEWACRSWHAHVVGDEAAESALHPVRHVLHGEVVALSGLRAEKQIVTLVPREHAACFGIAEPFALAEDALQLTAPPRPWLTYALNHVLGVDVGNKTTGHAHLLSEQAVDVTEAPLSSSHLFMRLYDAPSDLTQAPDLLTTNAYVWYDRSSVRTLLDRTTQAFARERVLHAAQALHQSSGQRLCDDAYKRVTFDSAAIFDLMCTRGADGEQSGVMRRVARTERMNNMLVGPIRVCDNMGAHERWIHQEALQKHTASLVETERRENRLSHMFTISSPAEAQPLTERVAMKSLPTLGAQADTAPRLTPIGALADTDMFTYDLDYSSNLTQQQQPIDHYDLACVGRTKPEDQKLSFDLTSPAGADSFDASIQYRPGLPGLKLNYTDKKDRIAFDIDDKNKLAEFKTTLTYEHAMELALLGVQVLYSKSKDAHYAYCIAQVAHFQHNAVMEVQHAHVASLTSLVRETQVRMRHRLMLLNGDVEKVKEEVKKAYKRLRDLTKPPLKYASFNARDGFCNTLTVDKPATNSGRGRPTTFHVEWRTEGNFVDEYLKWLNENKLRGPLLIDVVVRNDPPDGRSQKLDLVPHFEEASIVTEAHAARMLISYAQCFDDALDALHAHVSIPCAEVPVPLTSDRMHTLASYMQAQCSDTLRCVDNAGEAEYNLHMYKLQCDLNEKVKKVGLYGRLARLVNVALAWKHLNVDASKVYLTYGEANEANDLDLREENLWTQIVESGHAVFTCQSSLPCVNAAKSYTIARCNLSEAPFKHQTSQRPQTS